jgi:hypothetical protein
MAIVQISKIQQRSGNLVDLPQLDEAELGFASDAKRVFIGKTTSGLENIEVLTSYSDITFSQIDGATGNLNITTPADGQVLAYDGTNWVNKGGAANGLITLGAVSNVKITGGTNGYVLQTDGTGTLSWTAQTGGGGSGTPGGASGQIQFNTGGIFDGDAGLTWNDPSKILTVTGNANVGNLNATSSVRASTLYSNVANGTPPLQVVSTDRVANLNVSNSAVAGTVYTAAQPNITSVGTLSGLSVTATITGSVSGSAGSANSVAGGNVSGTVASATLATYATTANSVAGGNVSGTVASATLATYATTANSVAGANVTGTVASATLATYATTANAVAGANVSGTVASATLATYATTANAVAGANVSGAVAFATTANAVAGANVSGTVASATLATYATTANAVAGANVSGAVALATSATSANAVAGANVSGTVALATSATTATKAGTVTTAAQPNITSTGTLTSLTVSGALNVMSGTLTADTLTTGTSGTAGVITGNWSLSSGSRLTATYADLAEYYEGDKVYSPGQVVDFGGEKEVTLSTTKCSQRVAGVVSTEPAFMMNEDCPGHKVAVALQGRVPTQVTGHCEKGDLMVSDGNGHATAWHNVATIMQPGVVIGKAIQSYSGSDIGIIEIAIGRL